MVRAEPREQVGRALLVALAGCADEPVDGLGVPGGIATAQPDGAGVLGAVACGGRAQRGRRRPSSRSAADAGIRNRRVDTAAASLPAAAFRPDTGDPGCRNSTSRRARDRGAAPMSVRAQPAPSSSGFCGVGGAERGTVAVSDHAHQFEVREHDPQLFGVAGSWSPTRSRPARLDVALHVGRQPRLTTLSGSQVGDERIHRSLGSGPVAVPAVPRPSPMAASACAVVARAVELGPAPAVHEVPEQLPCQGSGWARAP